MLQSNGCGVSPIDSYGYCMASTESSTNHGCGEVLIRVGSEHADPSDASFDHVATMPCVGGVANSAAFDDHGNFHIYYVPSLGTSSSFLQAATDPTSDHPRRPQLIRRSLTCLP